jgi:hypothetical protein
MSGPLHLVIGYLAIRIAFGSGRGDADPSGALAAVAGQRGGNIALWIAAAAFGFMALWRLVETALGRATYPKAQGALAETSDRAKAFALAVVYLAFAARPRRTSRRPSRLENDLDGAVLLLLEDLVAVRRLLERHRVGGEGVDAQRVVVGQQRHDVLDPLLDVGLPHP